MSTCWLFVVVEVVGEVVVVQVAVIDTVYYQVDVTSSPPAVTHDQGNYYVVVVTQPHFFPCSLPHLIHPSSPNLFVEVFLTRQSKGTAKIYPELRCCWREDEGCVCVCVY